MAGWRPIIYIYITAYLKGSFIIDIRPLSGREITFLALQPEDHLVFIHLMGWWTAQGVSCPHLVTAEIDSRAPYDPENNLSVEDDE